MRSSHAKVLHPLAGRPLIAHVIALASELAPEHAITVVGHQAERVQQVCEPLGVRCVLQEPQLGTGHAVAQAEPLLKGFEGDVIVLYGDVPLLQFETVQALWEEHRRQQAVVTVLTAIVDNPSGYGRMIRDASNRIQRIVEERDATPDERHITEINSGIYCLQAPFLFAALQRVGRQNAQGEQYLTDVIGIAVSDQQTVAHVLAPDAQEIMGVNTRVDLAQLDAVLRHRLCESHMLAGVTIVDPTTTILDAGVRIGQDTVVSPQAQILGASSLGAGCHIGPNVVIQDSTLGDGVRVAPFCYIREQALTAHTTVPAFSHLSGA